MKKNLVTVRDVDDEILGLFKAKAAEHKMKMGEALTEAMQVWIRTKAHPKKGGKTFSKIKPFDWGKGTEKLSVQIDDILYGVS
ncbi:hypothetical protein [Candidatus Nitrosotenuis uzonensis]|uniref:Uncharacterized protein n=1 Tax=Candidatus Nitrosotenuis uzonensis TaxID=1407055 RepID=V6AUU3_9ARCH|nr:hypothetical protein [Candidatus Nitrosotenuis uzonensis]CDI06315.1 hypothetical protein NITUZ_40481 [Candidatus Nitrosotenuis uzonensis]